MADIHIQRIKNAMKKLSDGHVSMMDYVGKPPGEREMVFLSREK